MKQLEESGEKQVAEVDPDARLLNKGSQTVAGYNVQSVGDAKHKLIVSHEVTQENNDERQLASMRQAGMAELEVG